MVALLGRLQSAHPNRYSQHICVPCSAGCSSGEASWPKNWFMARPMKLSQTRVQYRK